jgi:hypothetical protein
MWPLVGKKKKTKQYYIMEWKVLKERIKLA